MIDNLSKEHISEIDCDNIDLIFDAYPGAMGIPGLVLLLHQNGDIFISNGCKEETDTNLCNIGEIIKLIRNWNSNAFEDIYLGCGNEIRVNIKNKGLIASLLDEKNKNRYSSCMNYIVKTANCSFDDLLSFYKQVK